MHFLIITIHKLPLLILYQELLINLVIGILHQVRVSQKRRLKNCVIFLTVIFNNKRPWDQLLNLRHVFSSSSQI